MYIFSQFGSHVPVRNTPRTSRRCWYPLVIRLNTITMRMVTSLATGAAFESSSLCIPRFVCIRVHWFMPWILHLLSSSLPKYLTVFWPPLAHLPVGLLSVPFVPSPSSTDCCHCSLSGKAIASLNFITCSSCVFWNPSPVVPTTATSTSPAHASHTFCRRTSPRARSSSFEWWPQRCLILQNRIVEVLTVLGGYCWWFIAWLVCWLWCSTWCRGRLWFRIGRVYLSSHITSQSFILHSVRSTDAQ